MCSASGADEAARKREIIERALATSPAGRCCADTLADETITTTNKWPHFLRGGPFRLAIPARSPRT